MTPFFTLLAYLKLNDPLFYFSQVLNDPPFFIISFYPIAPPFFFFKVILPNGPPFHKSLTKWNLG